jgi:hypothetical protein
MLENAVHSITDLRQVQIQAAQDKVRSGTALTYDQYISLLLSAAMIYDLELGDSKPSKARTPRQVYSHDIDTDFSYRHDTHEDASYNTWEVYNASFDRGPRLSKDHWTRLPEFAQGKWDKLSPDANHIILEAKSRYPRPPRKVNLHDLTRSDLEGIDAYEFLQAHLHELGSEQSSVSFSEQSTDLGHPPDKRTSASDDSKQTLLSHMTKRAPLPPGDLQRVLPLSINKAKTPDNKGQDININSKVYRQVNMVNTVYLASDHHTIRRGALVDRGANGGIAGDNVRIIHKSGCQVDVQGIDNHQIVDIPIVTAGAVVNTQRGEVIIIMHQYAWTKKGKTIHSSGQLEMYKQDVDDKSRKVSGKQRIKTLDGYFIPINIQSGLPYVTMRPYADSEWDSLPHVILTSDAEWNPSILDNDLDDDDDWFEALSEIPDDPTNQLFDQYGNYPKRTIVNQHAITPSILENYILPTHELLYQVHERKVAPVIPDYGKY